LNYPSTRNKSIVFAVSCAVLLAAVSGILLPVIIALAVVAGALTGASLLWKNATVRRAINGCVSRIGRRLRSLWA
jgi:Flp pilus assembly protein TadB